MPAPRPPTTTTRIVSRLRAVARLVAPFVVRVALGIAVVVVVAAVSFAIPRLATPESYVGETGLSGIADAMSRAFLHFDFGSACGWPGCPSVRSMWARGWAADVWMLLGTLAIGVGGGFALGLWCAARPGSLRARAVETAATVLFCAPVYVVGLGLLLLFHRDFGRVPLPVFFDAEPVPLSPLSAPWDWLRTLLVPWLVAAAPLAGMCLRLVLSLVREHLDADYVRTAIAKGLPHGRVVRGHAGPFARVGIVSLVGVSAPLVVTNLILVERVFAVPGFFVHAWRASGHVPNAVGTVPDHEMLAAITVWAALFIVVLGYAMDAVMARIDPRIRTAQRPRP